MKYLSFDIESTGLNDDDYIIEIAFVPITITTDQMIPSENIFHCTLECPSFESLKTRLSKFVIENNEELINKSFNEGITKEQFLIDFDTYMNSKEIKDFFGDQKPMLLGKSLSGGIDIPFLIRDFGRDKFLRKYFHHRNIDVSSVAQAAVDSGLLPEGCSSSKELAQFFKLGEDVDHTAISDSIDVAKMYNEILKLQRNNKKSIHTKYLQAIDSDDMGVSSKAMLYAFIGEENNSKWGNSTPCDPSDFGRCHRLLERFPEFQSQMHKMNKFDNWKKLVQNWDRMTEIYLRDFESGESSELYNLLQELNSTQK